MKTIRYNVMLTAVLFFLAGCYSPEEDFAPSTSEPQLPSFILENRQEEPPYEVTDLVCAYPDRISLGEPEWGVTRSFESNIRNVSGSDRCFTYYLQIIRVTDFSLEEDANQNFGGDIPKEDCWWADGETVEVSGTLTPVQYPSSGNEDEYAQFIIYRYWFIDETNPDLLLVDYADVRLDFSNEVYPSSSCCYPQNCELTGGPFDFEAGALSQKGSLPGPAITTEICWRDNAPDQQRLYVSSLANCTNLDGAAYNNQLNTPNRIFSFKRANSLAKKGDRWDITVPFLLMLKNGQPAIATPDFNGGTLSVMENQEKFVIPAAGSVTVIEDGVTWEARQEGARVQIYKNGVAWGRTNGAGENGTLEGFAVLNVRTAIDLDGDGKIANYNERIPFVLIQHFKKGLTLQTGITPGYGGGKYFVGPIETKIAF